MWEADQLLTETPFVGRESELSRLVSALGPAGLERSPVVDVTGEAGIGKSRLLRELAGRAQAGGWRVVTVAAVELEQDLPFSFAAQAAASLIDAVGADRSLGLLAPADRERVEPILADCDGHAHLAVPPGERDMDHRALVALLMAAAEAAPLLVILDDVHWADSLSAEWLAALSRRRTRRPLVVALARRGRTGFPALDPAAGRLDLGPLPLDDATRMVDPRIPVDARRRIADLAEGNPFYVDALARAAVDGRWTDFRPNSALVAVPAVVIAALESELAALDPDARLIAAAAAIAGDPFAAEQVAAVAELHPDAARAALVRLTDADLIRPTDDGHHAFRHPIVQAAVAENAPSGWRVAAHRRAAHILAESGAPAVLRSRHYLQAAEPGDEEAIAVLLEAAWAVRGRAPSVAARMLSSAGGLLPPGPDDRRRVVTLMEAEALHADADFAGARRALDRALASGIDLDDDLDAHLIAMRTVLDAMLGHPQAAEAGIADALARIGDRPARAQLLLAGTFAAWMAGAWQRASDRAAAVLAVAGASDAQRFYAAAIGAGAVASTGDLDRARELCAEAAGLVDRLPLPTGATPPGESVWLLSGLFWLGFAHQELGHYEDSATRFEQGLRLARESRNEHPRLELRYLLGAARLMNGELDAGRAAAADTLEYARMLGVDAFVDWTLGLNCWAQHWCGMLDGAVEAGEALERRLAGRVPTPPLGGALCALAEARLDRGEPGRAADGLLALAGGRDLHHLQPIYHAWAYRVLTACAVAVGDLGEASEAAEAAARVAAARGLARDRADALEAAATLELACDRLEPAVARAREALAAADHPFQCHRARLLLGQALARAGNDDLAIVELSRAHLALRSIGATRLRDRAAASLRTLGVTAIAPPPPGGDDGPLAPLSEREREIARLVRGRLTNREIATRLMVSEKTVERHLVRAFEKLAVSSRVELARLVEQSDDARPEPARSARLAA